jgi:hypothetical protein
MFTAVPAAEKEEKEKGIEFTYDEMLLACKKYDVSFAQEILLMKELRLLRK